MTNDTEQTLTGTPNDWWEHAEQITEAEDAERVLGTWYITNETRPGNASNYRISTPTLASNEPRKKRLQDAIAFGQLRPTDLSPKVRVLMRVPIVKPAWMEADFLIADLAVGSDERSLWSKTKAGNWQLVLDGRVRVGEKTMLQLHPAIASITEQI